MTGSVWRSASWKESIIAFLVVLDIVILDVRVAAPSSQLATELEPAASEQLLVMVIANVRRSFTVMDGARLEAPHRLHFCRRPFHQLGASRKAECVEVLVHRNQLA